MEIDHHPVVKIARKLFDRHNLTIPFDLLSIVKEYAIVIFRPIPIEGIDGVCLNLKVPGKFPTIIINSNMNNTRQNFTLAHELGHVVIPWHYGNIVDELDSSDKIIDPNYFQKESEANRFASEFLMPFNWVYKLYRENPDTQFLLEQIQYQCKVSRVAAEIRLNNVLFEIEQILIPRSKINSFENQGIKFSNIQKLLFEETRLDPNRIATLIVNQSTKKVAFCIESNNIVLESGASKGTHYFYQQKGSDFISSPYLYFSDYSTFKHKNITTHWWLFDIKFDYKIDNRKWRDILENLSQKYASDSPKEFKNFMNGKISGAYSSWKLKSKGSLDDFFTDLVLRFNQPQHKHMLMDEDFKLFLRKRCEELFHK